MANVIDCIYLYEKNRRSIIRIFEKKNTRLAQDPVDKTNIRIRLRI